LEFTAFHPSLKISWTRLCGTSRPLSGPSLTAGNLLPSTYLKAKLFKPEPPDRCWVGGGCFLCFFSVTLKKQQQATPAQVIFILPHFNFLAASQTFVQQISFLSGVRSYRRCLVGSNLCPAIFCKDLVRRQTLSWAR